MKSFRAPSFIAVAIICTALNRAHAQTPTITATIGDFIAPVAASASSAQTDAGRIASRLIDGSGWAESAPGSGVYLHTSNASETGASMWNGEVNSTLNFDLGRVFSTNGLYLWNYNEGNGYNSRGVKEFAVSSSLDDKIFVPVGDFTLEMAPGDNDYRGQTVKFAAPVSARYFRFAIKSNYRGGEQSGLSEVRFANAERAYVLQKPKPWRATYPRPQHPQLKLGQALVGAENVRYPADAGLVDVTKAPYGAKGDGKTDDTAALQRALSENHDKGAIIYFPNGVYRISDTLFYSLDNPDKARQTILQGQSERGTIIQLIDNAPKFQSPRATRALVNTGYAPAQRFGNEIRNLTFDTGVGNAGATGVQFIANNEGGMSDVTIVSGDGQGFAGLDLGYTDEQGPCLIQNVRVQGFDVGVRLAFGVASATLEHISVESQNRWGVRNEGQPLALRDLRSTNAVPALSAAGGFTVLIEAELEGTGAAKNQPAIWCESNLMARDVKTSGYEQSLKSTLPDRAGVEKASFDQWLSKPVARLFSGTSDGLRLPIRETPASPTESDISRWVSVEKFGAHPDDGQDDSPGIQAAIDSGARTIYLPRGGYDIGSTVELRGQVAALFGCRAFLSIRPSLTEAKAPMFRVAPTGAPLLELNGISTDYSSGDHFFVENNSSRALILRHMQINFQGADAYHGASSAAQFGDVFIEDVVGRGFRFANQRVWARQFNVEGQGTHISNRGGPLWILGYKTEGMGTLLETLDNGQTEVLGGLSYTVGDKLDAPMFVVDETSRAAISIAEVNFSGQPFESIVRQTRDGKVKVMLKDDALWERVFTLFSSG